MLRAQRAGRRNVNVHAAMSFIRVLTTPLVERAAANITRSTETQTNHSNNGGYAMNATKAGWRRRVQNQNNN